MPDMASAGARYEALGEEQDMTPSSVGHTTASAAAAQLKWGKNEAADTPRPRNG